MALRVQIDSIVKVAETREQKAASSLQAAQKNKLLMEKNLSDLEMMREDYNGKFKLSGSQGMNASKLALYHDFIQKINDAIKDQENRLEQAAQVFDQKKQQWEDAHQKTSGLQKLAEREQMKRLHQEMLNERNELDSHNSRLFFNKLNSEG